ncbi:MAG TPA: LPS assembly lipoprotein LptE, partial [Chitinivibrionales bacterium]
KVTAYANTPRSYGNAGVRQVTISEYEVAITVEVEFTDNKKNTPLFKGTVTGKGVYDFTKDNEEFGRKKAQSDVVDQILQNSLQSW